MLTAGFEFKKEDCWIGVYWKREDHHLVTKQGDKILHEGDYETLDIWICFIPCVPLHIVKTEQSRKE